MRPILRRLFRTSTCCLGMCVVCGTASANIEITGNAFPLVNTPGNFAAAAPGVVVGINGNPPGSGNMFVNGGSVLTSPVGTVGELSNGIGSVSVAGGGFWNISGQLNVGLAGHGTMNVSGNNAVSATSVTVGAQLGSGGTLSVSGSNPLASPGGLVVGDAGSGQFTVAGGFGPTTVSTPFVNIGDEASGMGTATMEAGTTWNIAGHLGVGVLGAGTLNVTGGGVPTTTLNTATATLGDQTSSGAIEGTAHLSGKSIWTNTGALVVGNATRAAMTMTTGSRLNTATLEVGRSSVGTLSLQGGTAGMPTTLSNSGLATLGTNNGGQGTATIGVNPGGTFANWASGGIIEVGRGGNGTLNIGAGGTVTSPGGVIAANATSQSTATVSGAGAMWTINGDLHVGGSASGAGGFGTLNIHTNGQTTVGGTLRNWPNGLVNLGGGSLAANAIQHDGAAARLAVSGGTLNTNSISAPFGFTLSGGAINATTITALTTPNTTLGGGTLFTTTYNGNLTNNGATLLPGASSGTGTTTVVGNYAQNSPGRLQIELASTSNFDKLVVTGDLAISGALLDVFLLGGFSPSAGNAFDILDWSTIQLIGGGFTLQLPALSGGLQWNTSQLYTTGVISVTSPVLLGDYNNNGIVDAADYVVWRDNEGTNNALANDPLGGTIGSGQYNQWRANFGTTAGSGADSINIAVPEPGGVVLFVIGMLMMFSRGGATVP